MTPDNTPGWLNELRMREGTFFRDDLDYIVARLPLWMRMKLRVWLREQEAQERNPEEKDLLDYVKKETSALLPLVPHDELQRVLQIVRLYAGGR